MQHSTTHEKHYNYRAEISGEGGQRSDAQSLYPGEADAAYSVAYEWNVVNDRLEWYGKMSLQGTLLMEVLAATRQQWLSAISPDDRERIKKEECRLLKTRDCFVLEYRVRVNSTVCIRVRDTGVILRNRFGTPFKWAGVVKLINRKTFGTLPDTFNQSNTIATQVFRRLGIYRSVS